MADPPNPKPTLHYEPPTPERGPARTPIVLGLAAVLGAGAWFLLGWLYLVGHMVRVVNGVGVTLPFLERWLPALLGMAVLALAAFGLFALLRRSPRRDRREAGLAFLVGVGAAVLVHGTCFAAST